MSMQSSSLTKRRSPSLVRKFSFADIKKATNGFGDKNKLGEGAFGKVYRGTIAGKLVAVKRMRMTDKPEEGFQSFRKEIELLTACDHVNIISLVGFCEEGEERILVYEFMSNGSLFDQLYNHHDRTASLTVEQRLEICLGIAKGLSYLHSGKDHNIIHSDLKADNILLDANLVPKISDFGLSRTRRAGRFASQQVTNYIKGTQGYIAPECYEPNYRLSRKADVYSFGVVFLEVLCERAGYHNLVQLALPYIMRRELDVYAPEHVRINISHECARECENLIRECLENDAHKRPMADEVVHRLELALKLQKQSGNANKQKVPSEAGPRLNIPQEFSNRIVLYHTSSGVILKTKDFCDEVRRILDAHGKRVDERDLYLDSSYKEQLRGIFGRRSFTLPQVFIGGQYIGGADELRRLDWSGELKKKLERFPKRDYPASCNTCGNMRFTTLSMCPDCCFWKMDPYLSSQSRS